MYPHSPFDGLYHVVFVFLLAKREATSANCHNLVGDFDLTSTAGHDICLQRRFYKFIFTESFINRHISPIQARLCLLIPTSDRCAQYKNIYLAL